MGKNASGMYVIDADYNIVSYNHAAEIIYPELKKGEKCYRCLQHNEEPCESCPVVNGIEGPKNYLEPRRNVLRSIDAVEIPLESGEMEHAMIFSAAEATEEAEFVVQAARACHVTAPLVITGGYTVDLAGRAEGVSPEERTTFTKAFCRKVHEDGMMPMIGGEAGWLSSSLDMTALTQEQIWVAQENSSVTWSGTYQIWQYTAQGSIDGISGIAGLNIITGDGRIFQ